MQSPTGPAQTEVAVPVVPSQGGGSRRGRQTVVDQAVEFLTDRGPATTSVIATGIGKTRSTVATSRGREAGTPNARIRRTDRDGEWALATRPARQLQEVA